MNQTKYAPSQDRKKLSAREVQIEPWSRNLRPQSSLRGERTDRPSARRKRARGKDAEPRFQAGEGLTVRKRDEESQVRRSVFS
jgi:hypothetical protein